MVDLYNGEVVGIDSFYDEREDIHTIHYVRSCTEGADRVIPLDVGPPRRSTPLDSNVYMEMVQDGNVGNAITAVRKAILERSSLKFLRTQR